MSTWEPGRRTVEFFIERGRLEHVDGATAAVGADEVLARSGRRLLTASAGLQAGDVEGAFVAAYDAYRMAAESLLLRQGLRSTGGGGSHVTVEDAVSAQFTGEIPEFAKPTFERFRRARHAAQYFDASAPEITEDDAHWALATARGAEEGTRTLTSSDSLPLFEAE
jgi:hypothetical protein